jgi:aspartate/methionine/tyrosine aminotransferase
VGRYVYEHQRGLFGYACHHLGAAEPTPGDLDAYDAACMPRVSLRAAFDLLRPVLARPGESPADVLRYVAARRHPIGAYRGGSSGFDEEARAFVAAHFAAGGVPATVAQVSVFGGGAKGAFLAVCAAIMCRREHERLHQRGGVILSPAGYYQSLRLIPPLYGGTIDVVPTLTGAAVGRWLADTADQARRCVYVPLVNNADGAVLDQPRAHEVARTILEHNTRHAQRPVYVVADDVYIGSYLRADRTGHPIGAVTGADLGEPELGRMSDWALTVVTSSKTFALPTSRIAFTTTTNPVMRRAVEHYRTVLSLGRVPQIAELTAAAAICLTPQIWINHWLGCYRRALTTVTTRLDALNQRLGYRAVWADPVDGGWYLPLRINPRLLPQATSSFDAYRVVDRDLGVLPMLAAHSGRVDGRHPAPLPPWPDIGVRVRVAA